MKKILTEFRDFISRGNVMNLAVGVIIGAAFQSIVSSLVNDIINPLLGLFVKADFSNLMLLVKPVYDKTGKLTGGAIRYGAFITAIINFVIMAFVIFMLVKAVNKIMEVGKKKEPPKAPVTKVCPFCQSEISIKAVKCPHCTSDLDDETEYSD
ncbi:MAG: large conductance mechanosensitive channel protein MscL [Bacillota bacterium]|nr:large conductance mechanosensitive channel protein MscL [Bacillota bacterium]